MRKIIFGIGIAAVSLIANDEFYKNGELGVKVSTLGIGAEYSMKYSNDLYTRIGINGYNYDHSGTESGIDYDIDLKLQTITLIADYHPFGNGFRLSGGLMLNNNELDFDGKASEGSYTINDVTYAASDIGSLDGKVDFKSVAPYIGIGYKNTAKSGDWSFTAELGAMYQGEPNVDLNVNCGSGLSAAQCTALRNDVAAEESQLKDSIDGFKWYPVVSVGIVYKF